MDKSLEDIFPIMDIENDCIISKMGDVTVAFEVQLPEIFSCSNNDYESIHQSWVKAIKVLPKHSILHKQDWFVESVYQSDFSKDDHSFLSRSSERFFNERPFLQHTCNIFLT